MDRDKIEKFLTIASGKKVPKWQIKVLIKMREHIKRAARKVPNAENKHPELKNQYKKFRNPDSKK